ncbi:MAG: hypothetical protein HUU35_09025, partial [Armatimonadetes bacterium]|nr:hypothetical protein [Armatimonadota bacterium]
MVRWLTAGLLSLVMAGAEVSVVAPAPKVTTVPDGGKQTVRTVSLANEVAGYTLSYDTISLPGRTDEIRSHWWAWTTGMTTLGMTSPGVANWYFQGFFNWTFDDESLHKRPATFKVLRDGGQDGAVEFTWDTPMVTARLVFALADGSDKLVMFGSYEPKSPVSRSSLKFGTYPTGFEQPRSRTVTTALRTARQSERVDLDLSKERWLLFEDTTPGRHGEGSAGLSIGTPEAFSKVSVGVGEYGLFPLLELAPNARAFTLALYSYPALPQYETTRAYYRAAGDLEAAWLATLRPETVLPTWELPEERVAQMRAHLAAQLDRPAERWRPDPTPPEFAWAPKLPDGPLRTVLFCPRWAAYETMELARRLELQVRHLYFDSARQLAEPDAWPYAVQTGIGSLGQGAIARQVVDLLRAPETELYLLPAVHGQALTPPLMRRLLDQVRAGRGLLLVGDAALLKSWPAELFATVE